MRKSGSRGCREVSHIKPGHDAARDGFQAAQVGRKEAEDVRVRGEESGVQLIRYMLQADTDDAASWSWYDSLADRMALIRERILGWSRVSREVAIGEEDRPVTKGGRRVNVKVYLTAAALGGQLLVSSRYKLLQGQSLGSTSNQDEERRSLRFKIGQVVEQNRGSIGLRDCDIIIFQRQAKPVAVITIFHDKGRPAAINECEGCIRNE